MSRISAVLVLAIALALGACGGKKTSPTTPPPATDPVAKEPAPADPAPADPAPAATPSDADLDKMFATTLQFLDDMAAAISSNTKDCKAMAKGLEGVFDKHKDLLAQAKAMSGNKAVDEKADAYMAAHKDRVDAASMKIGQGLQGCAEDADIQAAMKRFEDM